MQDRVDGLVTYLQDLKRKDPDECELILGLLADYHIETTPDEEVFWKKFLLAWKKNMS